MDAALRLHGIRKTFGSSTAVHELDLVVPTGALYGVIGPNGAGKTTTIRLIMSILFPDAGELSVLGHRSALEAKDRIGYLPEERGVYRKMRVGAFLTYMARLKGVSAAGLPALVTRGLERVGLAGTEKKRCEELSKGMLQKVQFLAAIIHQPDLLILDEPFSGLDPVSARLLRDLVQEEHRRGATILFSTHVMTAGRRDLRARRDDSSRPEGARRQRRRDPPPIRSADDPVRAAGSGGRPGAAARAAGVERVENVAAGSVRPAIQPASTSGSPKDPIPASAIRRITAAVTPARIELARPRLEDIFISLVSEGSAPAPGLIAGLREGSAGASA